MYIPAIVGTSSSHPDFGFVVPVNGVAASCIQAYFRAIKRSISDGGWTPTIITVTGTNVTVSGYTANGEFAGYFSVSGAVTNLVVNTEAFTAEIGG